MQPTIRRVCPQWRGVVYSGVERDQVGHADATESDGRRGLEATRDAMRKSPIVVKSSAKRRETFG